MSFLRRRFVTIWAIAAMGIAAVFLFQNFEKPMGQGDTQSPRAQVCFGEQALKAQKLWNRLERSEFRISEMAHRNLARGDMSALADIKKNLMPFTLYTSHCLKRTNGHPDFRANLEDIIKVLDSTKTYMNTSKSGFFEWSDSGGKEDPELVAPLVFISARVVQMIQELPVGLRSDVMQKFLKNHSLIVWNHHLVKWVGAHNLKMDELRDQPLQVSQWGCEEAEYPHSEIVIQKTNRELDEKLSYCNAVRSFDLYVIAGASEVLATHENDPTIYGLNTSQEKALRNYVNSGVELLRKHFSAVVLKNFIGEQMIGLILDQGAWKEHPNFKWAGITEKVLPKRGVASSATVSVSMSLQQAQDLIPALTSLYENKKYFETKTDFPNIETMSAIINVLVYRDYNKDRRKPAFTNYVDGTNGWYLDGVSKAVAPSHLSKLVLTGGWGAWSFANKDLQLVLDSMDEMLSSKDPKIIRHREELYGAKIDPLDEMSFYASFVSMEK